ncbi:Rieske (2Fe-2S) protein [Actinomycetospora endophytica]|uniref:Rieske (2Fe-2S) protein n=1 Tax=Actinomycetospora endophytica TaxID=2291215 RepID=A0ABS8PHV1_9PSEU|nr:Rieske (2Fe-2S) protein [Actinomycetospora endophytica]MCD2197841.1 Rieske (2Fe-2S) protein [Actinomycetospora endophytica]
MTSETTENGAAPADATTGLTRRRALCGLLVVLAAPGALAACSSAGSPPEAPPGGTPVSQIPVGSGTVVQGPNGPVLLEQPTAGVIKAYDATCPHQGVTVDPPVDGTITCPGHGSQFDATTGALKKGPAATGLTPISTRVVNGAVQFA